ncbi:2-aminoethanethiol dioxygenase [Helicoverpa armigera]|uniref:2-aminoethanethiol dioxygenase n=1 Tax=Helicoverpa armigera TaxID=29058 RepID=UPI000B380AF5|nr:2-aminoethanethiol dioxygenase [Helicoverpa armigera]
MLKMTFVDSCALLSSRLFSTFFIRKKFLCINTVRFHMDKRDEAKSTMELVNIPPIVSIYRHAARTFDDRYKNDLTTNLNKLKLLMDSLKAEDLGYDDNLKDHQFWRKPNKAPCTYIEVFQNSQINMSIFVLKPGFKMPLHDHPHMHGLLKVISGAVNIRSFSEYPAQETVDPREFQRRALKEAARLASGNPKRRKLFAEICSDRICTDNSDTCILTPTISNYHEIEALETPAAFFDILSPPYDTLIEGIGPRRCRYYFVSNQISTNLVELQETEVPKCFYCDQAPYLGPILG